MNSKTQLLKRMIREEVRRSLTEAVDQTYIDAIQEAIEDMLSDTEQGIDELYAGKIDVDEFRESWYETTKFFTGKMKSIIRNMGK